MRGCGAKGEIMGMRFCFFWNKLELNSGTSRCARTRNALERKQPYKKSGPNQRKAPCEDAVQRYIQASPNPWFGDTAVSMYIQVHAVCERWTWVAHTEKARGEMQHLELSSFPARVCMCLLLFTRSTDPCSLCVFLCYFLCTAMRTYTFIFNTAVDAVRDLVRNDPSKLQYLQD